MSPEAESQAAVIEWAAWSERRYPELKWLHHIPNGGSRHPREAANLKKQGVKAGVSDLSLPVARCGFHGLYIEMKYGRNKLSEPQRDCIAFLRGEGYAVNVCYSAQEAIVTIVKYLEGKLII